MKSINVFWYRIKGHKKNFGDELGPYIVNKLTDCKINYIPIAASPLNILFYYTYGLIKGTYSIRIIITVFKSLFAKEILVTAGSILSKVNNENCIIWGTGIGQRNANVCKAKYIAVRGNVTKNRLKEAQITPPDTIGDPALLLPILYHSKSEKKFKLGIIPHYIQYDNVKIKPNNNEVLIINMLDPIEKVIDNITSCEALISSSLHGIIVGHAYNIPCLWYNFSNIKLAGDNSKFFDYFSSVGIVNYMPFFIENFEEEDICQIIRNVENNLFKAKIQINIKEIQLSLLQAFPYILSNNYKNYINNLL